ncbi:Glycosyl transferase family 2 [uncultured archaeon]|nr:Glycosyl transferase family 2 [uncultured archaeon]
MEFSGLAKITAVRGKPKGNLLVAMPCHGETLVLARHLDFLSGQSSQIFDVILVLGPDYPVAWLDALLSRKKFPFAVIVAQREEDTGSAGGFFTGQKYALENGYGYVILADADCFPEDPRVIERLYEKREAGFVSPRARLAIPGGRVLETDGSNSELEVSVAYYSLLSRGKMESCGLYFMPAYMGCDDAEYRERLGKRIFADAWVSHPYGAGNAVQSNLGKHWLYSLNAAMLLRAKGRAASNAARAALCLPMMALFYPPYGRGLARAIASSLATGAYGKKLRDRLRKVDYSQWEILPSAAPKGFLHAEYGGDMRNHVGAAWHALAGALGLLGKNAVIEKCGNDLLLNLACATARKLYYRTAGGKLLLMADNKSMPLWAAKLILLLPCEILSAAFAAASFAVRTVARPKTRRYGV